MGVANRYPQPISQSSPKSPVTEAYRTVRTNIQFASVVDELQVLLFTSSQASEGKTTTAANVAVVSAQSGKRVLLIDTDMRKPQIHHRFQVSNLDGLSSILIRERTLTECIVNTKTTNLFILPSGPIPPNPSEMLSSKNFAQLMETCREEFDLVILDSPPVLAVTDALVLTKVADGVVFVVDAQGTNRNLAQKAIGALQQVNARMLGIVLNNAERSNLDGYYYYYSQDQSVSR